MYSSLPRVRALGALCVMQFIVCCHTISSSTDEDESNYTLGSSSAALTSAESCAAYPGKKIIALRESRGCEITSLLRGGPCSQACSACSVRREPGALRAVRRPLDLALQGA